MLVNDQAVNLAKAKVCVYADSVPCVGGLETIPEEAEKDGKVKLKISGCIRHIKMQWVSTEKQ